MFSLKFFLIFVFASSLHLSRGFNNCRPGSIGCTQPSSVYNYPRSQSPTPQNVKISPVLDFLRSFVSSDKSSPGGMPYKIKYRFPALPPLVSPNQKAPPQIIAPSWESPPEVKQVAARRNYYEEVYATKTNSEKETLKRAQQQQQQQEDEEIVPTPRKAPAAPPKRYKIEIPPKKTKPEAPARKTKLEAPIKRTFKPEAPSRKSQPEASYRISKPEASYKISKPEVPTGRSESVEYPSEEMEMDGPNFRNMPIGEVPAFDTVPVESSRNPRRPPRVPPTQKSRTDSDADDFNERKYQAYAEYYGLKYRSKRPNSSTREDDDNVSMAPKRRKGGKKGNNRNSNYSIQKACEQGSNSRACLKYYDSLGNGHKYVHPLTEIRQNATEAPKPVPSTQRPKRKPAAKGKGKKKGEVTPMLGPSIVGPKPTKTSSYRIPNKRRKGTKNGSTEIGKKEEPEQSNESTRLFGSGSDETEDENESRPVRRRITNLYATTTTPKYNYKLAGRVTGSQKPSYAKISQVPAMF